MGENNFVSMDKVRLEEILEMPIERMELSTRARTCILDDYGYEAQIKDILFLSDRELLSITHLGRKSLNQIKEVWAEMGIQRNEHGIVFVRYVLPKEPEWTRSTSMNGIDPTAESKP